MHKITLLLMFLISTSMGAQVIYQPFDSEKLGERRELKIQLPRNYNPEDKSQYPLIIVLDGDYLFEPFAGNADYHAYWGEMPNAIVVGVNQRNSREKDLFYDKEIYFPAHEGASFFEFIGMELIPYIESKYNVSKFRIVAGHDLSANFINYYLFKENPIFRAFILLSPDLAPEMTVRVQERLSTIKTDTFYYVATAENDIDGLKERIIAHNAQMGTFDNPKVHYRFDNFNDADHYSLVGLGIPKALNEIFSLYKPINKQEYTDLVLTYPEGPYKYLEKKYADIKFFYGFEKKVVENDIRAVAAAAMKKDDRDALRELSRLARKEFPDSMISAYYTGMYYENENNLKRALHNYQSGLLLKASDFIDKDMLLDKIYTIKDKN
ncbi:alpha/beta hydrolase-fold protein [Gelidibacter japonicus]|uniref:alpha/beta hydrolase n=1 Tax=Gelidibacter japonicus TaxID=1962232 RepID=UPI002020AEB2|nr:alpha/beta hydrolase-fold protein [Gelidibacter japonicus]MCL8007866.1 alpha/beta hydrolase-fold protein [Gelidibacter japonicus]